MRTLLTVCIMKATTHNPVMKCLRFSSSVANVSVLL
jgi:hypothetical protein